MKITKRQLRKLIRESVNSQIIFESRQDDRQIGLLVFETLKAIKNRMVQISQSNITDINEKTKLVEDVMSTLTSAGSDILNSAKLRDDNPESLLNLIDDYVIRVSFINTHNLSFFIDGNGGAWSPGLKTLYAKLVINKKWAENNSDNYRFFNNFKVELMHIISHELQHTRQLKKRNDSSFRTAVLSGQAFSRATSGFHGKEEIVDKISSLTTSFVRELKFLFGGTEENYSYLIKQQLREKNKKYAHQISNLSNMTGLNPMKIFKAGLGINSLEMPTPIQIIQYYLKPEEIEAYTKGWFFASKRQMQADRNFLNGIKRLTEEERINLKRERIKALFMKRLKDRINSLITYSYDSIEEIYENASEDFKKEQSLEQLKNDAEDSAFDFMNKIISYAKKRFGTLSDLENI